MNATLFKRQTLTGLTAGLSLFGAPVWSKQATSGWDYTASLYLWAAGIDAKTRRGAEVDVGFETLLENLEIAFMGAFEARTGRWGGAIDLIYMDVSADQGVRVPVSAAGRSGVLNLHADVDTKGWVVNPVGLYRALDSDRVRVDLLAGVRYLDVALDFGLDAAAGSRLLALERGVSQLSWDLIVGAKGRLIITPNLYVPFRFDIGAGESDLTWQAFGGLGYAFGQAEVALTYRVLAWEFSGGDALEDLSFSGPMLSGSWHF
jgi:hypothetical protein